MPLSDLHKQKRKKNFTVLALILGFVALIFVISIIRMQGWE